MAHRLRSTGKQVACIASFHGIYQLLLRAFPDEHGDVANEVDEDEVESTPRLLKEGSTSSSTQPPNLRKFCLASSAAGAALLFFDFDRLGSSSLVASYVLVRVVRRFLSPHAPDWASTAAMCASAGQILSTWIDSPHFLHPGYRVFLDHHGGKPTHVLRAMERWSRAQTSFPLAHSQTPLPVRPAGQPAKLAMSCMLTHGTETPSCTTHVVRHYFPAALRRAIRVYLVLHAILAVLRIWRARKRLRRQIVTDSPKARQFALETVQRYVENVARSTLFLSTYCTLAWWSSCVAYGSVFDRVSRGRLFAHTWISGIAVVLEPPGRRAELAGYCAAQALDTIWRSFKVRATPAPFIVALVGLLYS